jgi:hypothetical protein
VSQRCLRDAGPLSLSQEDRRAVCGQELLVCCVVGRGGRSVEEENSPRFLYFKIYQNKNLSRKPGGSGFLLKKLRSVRTLVFGRIVVVVVVIVVAVVIITAALLACTSPTLNSNPNVCPSQSLLRTPPGASLPLQPFFHK